MCACSQSYFLLVITVIGVHTYFDINRMGTEVNLPHLGFGSSHKRASAFPWCGGHGADISIVNGTPFTCKKVAAVTRPKKDFQMVDKVPPAALQVV